MKSTEEWRPQTAEYLDNSPISSPPPLDDLPSFEDSQMDPLVASDLTSFELEFPDPTSRGSPSSVRAEFDQDSQDLDMESDDSDNVNWKYDAEAKQAQEDITDLFQLAQEKADDDAPSAHSEQSLV